MEMISIALKEKIDFKAWTRTGAWAWHEQHKPPYYFFDESPFPQCKYLYCLALWLQVWLALSFDCHTDILLNVDSTWITDCPIFLISRWIHGTPNTHFSMFSKIGMKEKCGIGVEQSVPIKLCVIGVSGKSKKMSNEYLVFFQFLLPKTPNKHLKNGY